MNGAPWDYSITGDGPLVPNTPSELGAMLGRELARLADVEEATHPDMLPRCDGCAARLGTYPNQCEATLMDLIKAAAENEPFYCHKGVKDGDEPKRLCSGWAFMVMSR